MYEQHPEQVVAGVVQVHPDVLVHPHRRLQVAHLGGPPVPLDLQRHVGAVEEPRQLVQDGQQRDVRRAPPHPRHRAPRAGHGGVAHVDVPGEHEK